MTKNAGALRNKKKQKEISSESKENSKSEEVKTFLTPARFKMGIFIAIGSLLLYGIWWLFKPYEATMKYGICKVFMERNIHYPQTMKIRNVRDRSSAAEIWLSYTDAFGQDMAQRIRCNFVTDEITGLWKVKGISIGKIKISEEEIAKFNKTIPAIYAYPPELVVPFELPDNPLNLHVDARPFMMQIDIRKIF